MIIIIMINLRRGQCPGQCSPRSFPPRDALNEPVLSWQHCL
jgi:hypothetical protein